MFGAHQFPSLLFEVDILERAIKRLLTCKILNSLRSCSNT